MDNSFRRSLALAASSESDVRRIILVLGLLLAVSAAHAAEPKVRIGAPYREVRASLIQQGFIPQRVTEKKFPTVICRTDGLLCRLYPELEWCTPFGVHGCEFLFRNSREGSYWRVIANGGFTSQRDHPGFKVSEYQQTTPGEEGVTVAGDDLPSTAEKVPEPKFEQGAPYAAVRASFIKQGFPPQPVANRDPRVCINQALCAEYPELERCDKVRGESFCIFRFKGRPGFGWWRVAAVVRNQGSPPVLALWAAMLDYKSDEALHLSNPSPSSRGH